MTLDLSPYGQKAGLKTRAQEWVQVLENSSAYLGVIADIKLMIPYLPDDPPGTVPPRYAAKPQPEPVPATPVAPSAVYDL